MIGGPLLPQRRGTTASYETPFWSLSAYPALHPSRFTCQGTPHWLSESEDVPHQDLCECDKLFPALYSNSLLHESAPTREVSFLIDSHIGMIQLSWHNCMLLRAQRKSKRARSNDNSSFFQNIPGGTAPLHHKSEGLATPQGTARTTNIYHQPSSLNGRPQILLPLWLWLSLSLAIWFNHCQAAALLLPSSPGHSCLDEGITMSLSVEWAQSWIKHWSWTTSNCQNEPGAMGPCLCEVSRWQRHRCYTATDIFKNWNVTTSQSCVSPERPLKTEMGFWHTWLCNVTRSARDWWPRWFYLVYLLYFIPSITSPQRLADF